MKRVEYSETLSDSATASYFKTAVTLWKCLHGVAPASLQELCVPVDSVQGRPRLRSASTECIQLPRVQTSIGERRFAFCGPAVWNSLPPALHDYNLSLDTKLLICSDNDEHHQSSAALWRFFCDFWRRDTRVLTYLLTDWLTYLTYLLETEFSVITHPSCTAPAELWSTRRPLAVHQILQISDRRSSESRSSLLHLQWTITANSSTACSFQRLYMILRYCRIPTNAQMLRKWKLTWLLNSFIVIVNWFHWIFFTNCSRSDEAQLA